MAKMAAAVHLWQNNLLGLGRILNSLEIVDLLFGELVDQILLRVELASCFRDCCEGVLFGLGLGDDLWRDLVNHLQLGLRTPMFGATLS